MIRVSTRFVVLDALVENKKTGQPIGSLKAKDFLLAEDGVPQNISYFTHDQLPLSVVFLFDLTETVQPVLEPLAEGAREILSHLKPQDEVSVMVFSSHSFSGDGHVRSAFFLEAKDSWIAGKFFPCRPEGHRRDRWPRRTPRLLLRGVARHKSRRNAESTTS
jgi:hypothetical protein